jgi:hypothetical protein
MRIFGFGKKQVVQTEQVMVSELQEGDTVREGSAVSTVVVVLPSQLDTNHVKVGLSDGSSILAREDETIFRVLAV